LEIHRENQLNVEGQSTQQIGQNPINYLVPVPEKRKAIRNTIIFGAVVAITLLTIWLVNNKNLSFDNRSKAKGEQITLGSSTPSCEPISPKLIFTTSEVGSNPSFNGPSGKNDAMLVTDYSNKNDTIGIYDLTNPLSIKISFLIKEGFSALKAPALSSQNGVVYWRGVGSKPDSDQIVYENLNKIESDREIIIRDNPDNIDCGGRYFTLSQEISDDGSKAIWWEFQKKPQCAGTTKLLVYEAGPDKQIGTNDDIGVKDIATGVFINYVTLFSISNSHAVWTPDSGIGEVRMTYFGADRVFGTGDDISNVLLATKTRIQEVEAYENGVAYTRLLLVDGGVKQRREIYVYDFGADHQPLTKDDKRNIRLIEDGWVGTVTGEIGVKDGLLAFVALPQPNYHVLKGISYGPDKIFGTTDDYAIILSEEASSETNPLVLRPSLKSIGGGGYLIVFQRNTDYYLIRKCLSGSTFTPTPTPKSSPTPTPTPLSNSEGQETFCGGFAGVTCPNGYTCKLDGSYPDSGGTCVKK